jgi:hypothetical protein
MAAVLGLVLAIALIRPWTAPDPGSRQWSALIAAGAAGWAFVLLLV